MKTRRMMTQEKPLKRRGYQNDSMFHFRYMFFFFSACNESTWCHLCAPSLVLTNNRRIKSLGRSQIRNILMHGSSWQLRQHGDSIGVIHLLEINRPGWGSSSQTADCQPLVSLIILFLLCSPWLGNYTRINKSHQLYVSPWYHVQYSKRSLLVKMVTLNLPKPNRYKTYVKWHLGIWINVATLQSFMTSETHCFTLLMFDLQTATKTQPKIVGNAPGASVSDRRSLTKKTAAMGSGNIIKIDIW